MGLANRLRLCAAIFGVSAALAVFAAFAGEPCVRDSSVVAAPLRPFTAAASDTLDPCDVPELPAAAEYFRAPRLLRNAARGVPRLWRMLPRRTAPNALAPERETPPVRAPERPSAEPRSPRAALLAVLKNSRPVRAGPTLL